MNEQQLEGIKNRAIGMQWWHGGTNPANRAIVVTSIQHDILDLLDYIAKLENALDIYEPEWRSAKMFQEEEDRP